MPESPTSQRNLTAAQKQARALELRASGMSFNDIAEELGYRSHSGAHKAVTTGLRKTLQEPADELRTLEAERLDRMTEAIWKRATSSEGSDVTWCIDRVLNIMERRARLLGLDAGNGDTSPADGMDFLLGMEAMRAEFNRRKALSEQGE